MRRRILTFILFCCLAVAANAQVRTLTIGDSLPDLKVKYVINFKKEALSISEFRGKFLILDFWNTSCVSCIKFMQENEHLLLKYSDKLQILGITNENRSQIDKSAFKRLNIKTPSITRDTILHKLFPHQIIPHYIWINEKGVIVAITGYKEMTSENLLAVVNGKKPDFLVKDEAKLDSNFNLVDGLLPEIVKQNSQKDIYFSVFRKYDASLGYGNAFNTYNKRGLLFVNVSIKRLYQYACDYKLNDYTTDFGSTYLNRFIWEVADSSYYSGRRSNDDLFSYNLVISDTLLINKDKQRSIMKSSLDSYFGLKVSKQRRNIPCYILSCFDHTKLKSNLSAEKKHFTIRSLNEPFDRFVSKLEAAVYAYKMPLINETGINKVVNLELGFDYAYDFYDLVVLNKELKKVGLFMSIENRVVDVIVVSDKVAKTSL